MRPSWSYARTPLDTRFWAKVEKTDDCWLWKGATTSFGYGHVWVPTTLNKGRYVPAHRVAYELMRGAIPTGLTVDHLCRNRRCVNPEHLEAVTNRENILRGESVSAHNARKTHCKHGHEFSADNTRVDRRGRRCLTCQRRWKRAENARLKAERHARGLKR